MAIRASDSFASGGRGSPNAWSPASDAESWLQAQGSATLGFTGTAGTLTGSTGRQELLLGALSVPDIDVLVHSTTLTNDTIGVFARYSGGNYYRGDYNPVSGLLTITKRNAGTETVLASTNVGTPTAPGWTIHLSLQGSSLNDLALSWWDDSGGGDPGFALLATDSTFRSAGQVGLYGKASASGDVLSYDSFVAQDPNPFPSPPAPPASIPDSPYGNTFFAGKNNPSYLPQQAITDLLGICTGAWLRYQLRWSSVEPNADGVYNWAYMDWAVTLCNSYGLNILWPIQTPPNGYLTIKAIDGSTVTAGTGSYASASAWATFVTAVCARYSGAVNSPYSGYPMLINGVQLGNEDYDLSKPGVGNNQPARDTLSQWLVPVINACYPIIRANMPANTYIGVNAVRKTPNSALLHIQNWIANLYTYGGGVSQAIRNDPRFFLDFHYYRDGTVNLDGSAAQDPTTDTFNTDGTVNCPSVEREIAAIRAIIAANGADNSLWNTEWGWNLFNANTDTYVTDTAVVSAAQDALYQAQMLNAQRLGGCTHTCRYTFDAVARVTTKNLQASPTDPTIVPSQCSTFPKSVTQLVNDVYTTYAGYSDPAGGNGLVQYAALYPLWPGTTASQLNVVGLGGSLNVTGLDGCMGVAGLEGKTNAVGIDGKVNMTGLDGSLMLAGGD